MAEVLRKGGGEHQDDVRGDGCGDVEHGDVRVTDELRQEVGASLERDLGPFYDDEGLMKRYHCTQSDLEAMVAEGVLVAVPVEEGGVLYPACQFVDQTSPHPDMPTFVAYLKGRRNVQNPSINLAQHLIVCPNPYAGHYPDQDTSTTVEMIHDGRVADTMRYWDVYYKGLEGPGGGWY